MRWRRAGRITTHCRDLLLEEATTSDASCTEQASSEQREAAWFRGWHSGNRSGIRYAYATRRQTRVLAAELKHGRGRNKSRGVEGVVQVTEEDDVDKVPRALRYFRACEVCGEAQRAAGRATGHR